jgi:pimeloyl-ACP methyl ester carboxylesterase
VKSQERFISGTPGFSVAGCSVDEGLIVFPDFLPSSAQQLTEDASIQLAQQIQQRAIATPLAKLSIPTSYVQQGSGALPILLIHGFDSSVMEYRRLMPILAQHHETWAIDLLTFGFTERLTGLDFSAAEIKQHLYASWKALIGRPVVLVGASMGGAAAIDFALTYPDAVDKLILLDSAGGAKGPNMGRFLIPPMGFLAAEFLRNGQVRRSISRAAYFDKSFATEDAACCAALHLECEGWNRAMVAFTRSGGYNTLRWSQIAEVQQPTLMIWGENDQIIGTKDAGIFEQTIGGSKLIWIENCGHVPHLEKAQDTAHHILAFIQSYSGVQIN